MYVCIYMFVRPELVEKAGRRQKLICGIGSNISLLLQVEISG